jgi:pSer/pThr/pTyr-binding forkhead associated (FHA) protein
MKVSLVVTASGPNQGRSIALTSPKFAIGRDPDCQLRPASQAVSKRHCAIEVREGKVYVLDIGSTNGTFVRGVPISGEVEVQPGDTLKVGPLEFRFEFTFPKAPELTPTIDGLKAVTTDSSAKMKPITAPPLKTGSSTASKPVQKVPAAADAEADAMAAMLLALDADDTTTKPGEVPEGSTIMDMPAANVDAAKKEKEKKKMPSGAEMSNAANDILRRYIRRTGGGPGQ